MSKCASVNTRVDPQLKEQAESVLDELGMSMATAMTLFLKQIVIHNGLPFDVRLPQAMPTAYGSLSDSEFNLLMQRAAESYAEGRVALLEDFETKLSKEIEL